MNDPKLIYEIIGYIASILVAISLMMSSILKLRIINLIGAIFFMIYGLAVGAYPVAAVNFFIVLINLYYLWEIFTAKEYFDLLEVRTQSDYLKFFLKYYAKDIERFLPGFQYTPTDDTLVFFILRNMVPAGVFIGEQYPSGTLLVKLDFVIPGYRDFKTGHFLFSQKASFFHEKGIRQIYSPPGNSQHAEYLQRMGFMPERVQDGQTLYHLELA